LLLSFRAEPRVAPAPQRAAPSREQDTLWRSLETSTSTRGSPVRDGRPRCLRAGSRLAATAEKLLRAPVPSDGATLIRSSAGSLRWRRWSPRARAISGLCATLGSCVEAIKWQSRRWTSQATGARAPCTAPSMVPGAVERRCCSIPTAALPSSRAVASPRPRQRDRARRGDPLGRHPRVARRLPDLGAHRARQRLPGQLLARGAGARRRRFTRRLVIEAHIERGVAVSTADAYLRDKKLRSWCLRLRSDLAPVIADPLLPHRAASLAPSAPRSGRVAYDFEMDYTDPSKLFARRCLVGLWRAGVRLWTGSPRSRLPAASLVVGVRRAPLRDSGTVDLEYDPQLVVVAEWRDAGALMQDHIDNAAIDAMLEGAERGRLSYPCTSCPARLAKAYSWVSGAWGRVPSPGCPPGRPSATARSRTANGGSACA